MRTTPLLVPAALAAGVLIGGHLAAPAGGQIVGPHALPFAPRIEVAGIPTPQQMMRVVEGTPFTVPQGKLFVVTGLGSSGDCHQSLVSFDGTPVLYHRTLHGSSYGAGPYTAAVPPGLVAASGQVVTALACGGSNSGVVLGYLADA